jgi:hypothetical protein
MGKRIGLDFDGVLHTYERWTGYEPEGDPIEGSLTFVRQLVDDGYDPFVFSSRADCEYGRYCIQRWLLAHDFPAMEITQTKLPAAAYVDDRAVAFQPQNGLGFVEARLSIEHLSAIRI